MKKRWNKIKEERRDDRIKKLEKQALHYIQENERLKQHIDDLQGSNKEELLKMTKKKDDEDKKISQKQGKKNTTYQHDSDSKIKESDKNEMKSITHKHKRPRKRSTRCHLCRKRGHTKGECPFGPVLPEWP